MKKLFAAIITLAISSMLAIGAAAADSPTGTGLVKTVTAVGNESVQVTLSSAPAAVVEKVTTEASLKEVLGANYTEGMKAIVVQDVTVPEGTQFPLTLTFEVSGVDESTTGYFIHYTAEGVYEVIPATFSNGTMTGTFNSLSPVALVVDGATATAIEQVYGYDPSVDAQSPQTGAMDFTWIYVVSGLCLIASPIVFVQSRKKAVAC